MQKRSYGLPKYEASLLVDDTQGGSEELANYFEACVFCCENLEFLALWHITQMDEKDIPKDVAKYPGLFYNTFKDVIPTPTQVAKFILNEMKAQSKKCKMDVWGFPPGLTACLLLFRRAGMMNNKDIQTLITKEYMH